MITKIEGAGTMLLAGRAKKELEYGSTEPKLRNGLYSYLVPMVVFDGERATTVDVTVEAKENPVNEGMEPGTPVVAEGMRISFGTYSDKNDGGKQRKYWRLCCDSIAPAKA